METGVCQPFYYIKLSCIENAKFTHLDENSDEKYNKQVFLLFEIDSIY